MTIESLPIGAALAAFVVAAAATRALELLARRVGLFAPITPRGAHSGQIPRVGGPGIAAGALLGSLVLNAVGEYPLAVVVGAFTMLGVGFLDDLRSLQPRTKYVSQLVIAFGVAGLAAPVVHLDLPGSTAEISGWSAAAIVAFTITGVVNAFNFMDGSDGLAASMTVAWAPAAIVLVPSGGWQLAWPLAWACLGFLVWNSHPATVFMGDGGSLFIGCLVGAILFLTSSGMGLVTAGLTIAPILIDTSATLVRRVMRGEDVTQAHNGHLYQRLRGSRHWSPRRLSLAYAAAMLGGGASAVAYANASEPLLQAVILGGWVALWAIALWLIWTIPTAVAPRTLRSRDPHPKPRPSRPDTDGA